MVHVFYLFVVSKNVGRYLNFSMSDISSPLVPIEDSQGQQIRQKTKLPNRVFRQHSKILLAVTVGDSLLHMVIVYAML